ncbi:MAG TPA: amino acid adenylation domain-containing protein [Thermoanaerobaculia bacterium]|nr:amino acid adenylation domain-containing protein [Thermoanaerobaculia bacterium]
MQLPLQTLFEAPTVAGLAREVEDLRQRGETAGVPPIVPVPREGDLPLSFAQQRLWVLDQLEPGSAAYNIPFAVRLRGAIEPGFLVRIFAEVVRRHEALRTTFDVRSGEPVQVIAAPYLPALPVVDLAALPEARREARAREIVSEEAQRPFDLRSGPLLRLGLVQLAEGDALLLLNVHHSVSDGWSTGVLLREIGALGEAFARGDASPLPELPVQYADFAVWQRGWLQGAVLEEEIGYWKRQLDGAPRLLELPTDRPRPAVQTFRGSTRSVVLASIPELMALCHRAGATPFMALLAAWALLLGRHAGQDDVMVGSPVAGRNRREIEDLIGFFVNTLVLRTDLSGRPTFRDLLGRVREVALGAFAHQDLPFERLVEELVHERDLAISPLFQVLLTLQNVPAGPVRLPGLELTPVMPESEVAKFDLSLYLFESAERIEGFLEFNTDLFDGATAERLAERFVRLVAGAVAHPEQPLGELPLLGPAELEQLLTGWNDTAEPFPADLCVHELIAAQAARTPQAVAVSCGGEELLYGELEERAARFARRLVLRGVGPETLVGLRAGRTPALLVGLLGVLKAGGAYVPLDPTHPRERLDLILEDAGIQVLITDRELDEETEDVRVPLPAVDPESLAYVIYTSGSTGRPKGVGVRHRGVVNYLSTMAERPGLSADDVVMALTTLSFDIAVTELLLPLTVGARVELVDRETAGDPALLAAVLESSGATVMQATPATWSMLVEGGWPGRPGLKALCGGEALPRALADRLLPRVGQLWNVYGPTETTVWSARHLLRSGERQVPLGLPLGNTTIHLVGRWGELVPPGAAGELLIGGAGLARGYHGRPDLTAERFVPDPFWNPADRTDRSDRSDRLYRTGDLARRLPDGTLEYLGRIDFQVKVRGFRIELGEIEAVLGTHPDVRECVVVARDGRLVAYLVPRGEQALTEDLRGHLRTRLPEYMVPSAFVSLEAFPLTPSGKVDRKALPAPESTRGEEGVYVAPSDPVEELLAGIWAEVLGLERVGIHDQFFALGGHSLLATRVVSRIRDTFGVEVPLRRLFEAPTVAELARSVRESQEGGQAQPIVSGQREGGLPLSFAQQRLWVLDQLEPGSAAYNIPLAVRLSGDLPEGLLERVFSEIVRRHEALRTTFAAQDGRPVQVIGAAAPLEIPVTDLRPLPAAARDARARELAREEAQRPFDLQRGPLLRLTLVRLGELDQILLITVHHAVSDAWSLGVLLREVAVLYEAFAEGRPSPLPELTVQYADFSMWQRGWLQGAVLDEQLGFWKRQLAGAPPVLELPTDRPRPVVQTFRGASRHVALSPDLSQAVAALCRQQGATPFMALLAAWALLLGRHAGQDDVVVGTPVAGRNHRKLEDLIGFFVNTLVLRADLSGSAGFAGLLGRVREAALDAFAHQDVPFERLVEELVTERDLAISPLFQVLFVLQNAPTGELRLPGLSLTPVETESEVAKFDLSLYLTETPGGIAGWLEHNTDLFDAGTAERLVARFAALLAAAVADPEQPIGDLTLLLPVEREQLLTGWNDTAETFPADLCVHELIAAQAVRTPEAVAVSCGGERLLYRELEERAGRLARRLAQLDVGPEVLVGLCAERSPALLVGLLGVLKAGGAYVPLDPTHPQERLGTILADAGVPVLVTERALLETLPPHAARVVLLDEETHDLRLPLQPAHPENLAYVIYTSGSTGRPKGVGVRHRGVVNYLATMAARPGLAAGDVMMALTTLSFDIAATELLLPLTVGARIELLRRETTSDAVLLAAALQSAGATAMQATPATWTLLVEGGWQGRPGLKALCGGEALPRTLADRLLSKVGELWNVYGPTETTVWSACHRVEPGDRQVSLGLPLGNTTIHLLGRWGELVPPGAAGELLIGGAGLARGYHGRPDLTAERFVPDPFGEPGARLYRTGDLARRLPDGTLEYLGRIDFQVKVRGFRIELGEIEAVLAGHPEVRECVAVARREGGDVRLVAYLVPRGEEAPPSEALREHLRQRLPEYMVPSAFVPLDAFPLTPSGKVDRKALPAPDHSRRDGGRELVLPRTRTEAAVVEMWKAVLTLGALGVEDSFFELGGHSLLATQVLARIRQSFGVEIPLVELFRHPTVAALAGLIDAQVAPPPGSEELTALLDELDLLSDDEALRVDPREILARLAPTSPRAEEAAAPASPVPLPRPGEGEAAVFPLSFAQQRLWFLDRLQPGNPVYNIPMPVRLHGALPLSLLERIFAAVATRHEALRTTFAPFADTEDGPVQVIHPQLLPRMRLLDLSGLPAAQREIQALRIAQEEAYLPFDLQTGPLLRLSVVRLSGEDHLLLVTLHHIVSDGWSMGVLLREVGTLWGAFSQGKPSPLPPLPIQYADFAVWQRRWLHGRVLDEQLAFWKNRLAGAPLVLTLPTDRPRPPLQTYRGASTARLLPLTVSAAVRELCQQQDVTPFMALLAAWAVLLARHSGQDDVPVGTPVAGRHRRETTDLIGFFVNTLVVRVELAGAADFRAAVEQVRHASLGAFIHQDLPFERIVEEIVVERDPSHTPLFQVMFALQQNAQNAQSAQRPDVRTPALTLSPVPVEGRMAKFDLTLTAADGPDGFSATLEYNTDLFDGSTAERLLARFEVLLAAAAAEPGRPLKDLPLLPEAERHQVLVEWNELPQIAPQEASFPERFAAVARAFPEEPAVVSAGGEIWSYRRLDEASNRLARQLRALGAGLDEAVGICMERSPELILGVVAVLKAGGIYVPLNPAHPDDRLLFQIEDTGAKVVLVHAGTRERLPGHLRLEVDPAACANGDGSPLTVRVPAESLCYVIYTSGSTGVPKGVGVPHGAAMLHSAVIAEDDKLGPGERVVQFSSLSFDVSLEQMLPTLTSGAAVVLRDEDLASPAEMLSGFARLGITSANLPTAYWHQAVQSWSAEASPEPLRLRVQCVGGEAMLPEAARRWMSLAGQLGLGDVRLINGYGPTETVVTATRYTVPDSIPPEASSVPIGRLLPLRSGYAVDPGGALQPVGVSGELCLGGILARGYVNRPDLTAERFVPDPFSGSPGSRLYRTGDLVRFLPDGNVDYLGRIDRQVKIRGFRIEPGEIEAALAAHPGVRDCAVVVRREPPAGDRLVAYVVPGSAGAGLTVAVLREWLKKTLPDYMVPAAMVFLDALPLTPNGKVDRKALPAPGRTAVEGEEPVAVRDELELRLVRIWEDLLDVRPVGLRDSFFALGGHSLLAVRLVGMIERQLNVKVPLTALMTAPTVEQMARLVREEVSLPRLSVVPIETSGSRPPLFLVHPVGGNVFCYLPLVRGGGLEGPVFGLQAPAPDALPDPWTIETMAERYIAALREVQPEGPYRLGGWSLGGVVAWEMARQLTEHGSAVELLAMIDPGTPQQVPEAPDPHRELAQFLFDLGGLAGLDPSVHRELPAGATLDDLLARKEVRALLPPEVAEEQIHELFALFRANVRALGAWTPRPYGGCLTLLRAAASAAAQPEAAGAWSGLALGGAEVHVLPGDHYSLLRAPQVAALAERLAACCRLLDGGPASPPERQAALSPAKRDLLAALLREKRAGAEAILPRGTTEPAPLSFAQERMWFLHSLDPQSPAYNVHLGVRLDGVLRPEALAAGLFELRRRHQVLATRYELAGAQPVQVIETEAPLPLPTIDLSGLPAELRSGVFDRLQSEEGGRPFDLRRGPVMRTVLVRLAPEEHALSLTIHHVATDGWSRGIMVQDLAALYGAFAAGKPARLPEPRLQYADFAVWQRRRLQGQALEEQLAYWRRQLEPPLPILQLPTDRPREARQTFRTGVVELAIPAGLTAELRALGNSRGATLFMVLLAGLTGILQRSGGDERILVGAPVAGRTRVEVEELVGFFLNNLVIGVDLAGDPSFAGLLDNAAQSAFGAFAHQELPLETLLQRLRLDRNARGPFQVMLLLQNLQPHPSIQVPGLTLSPLSTAWDVDLGTDIFEIGLTVEEHGPALHVVTGYNSLLFDESTIQRLIRQLPVLLRGAVADPGTPLSELPLLAPGEESEILAWSQTVILPAGLPVGDLLPPEAGAPEAMGTCAYVVDRAFELVPLDVRGELLLGGSGLQHGDLGRAERTAERFVPDPFSGDAGARLYRTGDLARRRADGSLELVGRIDRQVKIRGVRIEPEEIEAVLAACPEVGECAVVAREDTAQPDGLRLVAYVVPAPGAAASTAFLRTFLESRLPAWMVPAAFVSLIALPRTAAGTIDRRALPAPEDSRPESVRPDVSPRNEVEEVIAEIWCEALGLERLSVFDGFFELGGHSLLLLQVMQRLRDAFDVEIPLRSIYEERTVAALAIKVEELALQEIAEES